MASTVDFTAVQEVKSTEDATLVSEKDRKVFVGGLSQESTEVDLRDYFCLYGEIDEVEVKRDQFGISRGFGFVVFKTQENAQKVIEIGKHSINSKKVDVQKPKTNQGKVFVGGLNEKVSEDAIMAHFNTFGTVVEIQRPYDRVKLVKKPFCFVVFTDQGAVGRALKHPKQTVNGQVIDVKSANAKANQTIAPSFTYPMPEAWYGESSSSYQVPSYSNVYIPPGSADVPENPMHGEDRGKGTGRGRGRFQPY